MNTNTPANTPANTTLTPMTREGSVLIAYHANCIDGFTAAWAAYNAVRIKGYTEDQITLHAVSYSAESEDDLVSLLTPEYTRLLIVDFSVSLTCLGLIQAHPYDIKVSIIDHHKTAFERYFPAVEVTHTARVYSHKYGAEIILNNAESGASLVWKELMPIASSEESKLPYLIRYVRDYDLWQFKLGDDTKYVNKMLVAAEKSIDSWNLIAHLLEDSKQREEFIYDGSILQRKHMEECERIAAGAYDFTIGEHTGLAVACKREFISDVGHILATESGTFGALVGLNLEKGVITYSLRSNGDFDVSAIAKRFGGGGHKNAAGFAISMVPADNTDNKEENNEEEGADYV